MNPKQAAPPTQEPDAVPADEDAGGDASGLSKDLIFEILKNERRRHVLAYLDEHDAESSLSDLAEHIAAVENDVDTRMLSSAQRKRVYIALYQCHLPKMADAGIIEYEQARGTVELRERSRLVFPYLYHEPGSQPTGSRDGGLASLVNTTLGRIRSSHD